MEEYYTIEEIMKVLKVSRNTVYSWIKEGRIKGVKIGRQWRIPKTALNQFLTTGQQEGDDK